MFDIKLIEDAVPEGARIHRRTAVRGIIYEKEKLLMIQTNDGDYIFPGGGVKEGENHREALLREIREETGYLDVTVGPCVGTVYEQNDGIENPGTFFQMDSFYYVCQLNSRKQIEKELEDYEGMLGFHERFVDVKTAYEANARLLAKRDSQQMSGRKRTEGERDRKNVENARAEYAQKVEKHAGPSWAVGKKP